MTETPLLMMGVAVRVRKNSAGTESEAHQPLPIAVQKHVETAKGLTPFLHTVMIVTQLLAMVATEAEL